MSSEEPVIDLPPATQRSQVNERRLIDGPVASTLVRHYTPLHAQLNGGAVKRLSDVDVSASTPAPAPAPAPTTVTVELADGSVVHTVATPAPATQTPATGEKAKAS